MPSQIHACVLASAIIASLPLQAADARFDRRTLANAGTLAAAGAQDGTDYFDYHHTANDTLDKVDAKALDQQVAAYAAMAYVAADSPVDFGRAPPLTGEE